MGLLAAFKSKYGERSGERLFRSQRKLASASAAYKRTRQAIDRKRDRK